jgi:hypothetical protein
MQSFSGETRRKDTAWKRLKRRWEDNIKIGSEIVDFIDLVQDRNKWRVGWTQKWNTGFHKMQGISWPIAEPSIPRTIIHAVGGALLDLAQILRPAICVAPLVGIIFS